MSTCYGCRETSVDTNISGLCAVCAAQAEIRILKNEIERLQEDIIYYRELLKAAKVPEWVTIYRKTIV